MRVCCKCRFSSEETCSLNSCMSVPQRNSGSRGSFNPSSRSHRSAQKLSADKVNIQRGSGPFELTASCPTDGRDADWLMAQGTAPFRLVSDTFFFTCVHEYLHLPESRNQSEVPLRGFFFSLHEIKKATSRNSG